MLSKFWIESNTLFHLIFSALLNIRLSIKFFKYYTLLLIFKYFSNIMHYFWDLSNIRDDKNISKHCFLNLYRKMMLLKNSVRESWCGFTGFFMLLMLLEVCQCSVTGEAVKIIWWFLSHCSFSYKEVRSL